MTQHANLPDSQLHEPKGVASASVNDVYVADGAGSGTWKQPIRVGVYDYNDATTSGSPIALTTAGTWYYLTNDGAGAYTNKTYALTGVPDIFDTSTGAFDFSLLDLGDTVDIRVDVTVTTSGTGHAIDLSIEAGIGGTSYSIPFSSQQYYKSSGAHQIAVFNSIYIGDANTKGNPAKLRMKSDSTGDTVVVNGWYVRVIKKGE